MTPEPESVEEARALLTKEGTLTDEDIIALDAFMEGENSRFCDLEARVAELEALAAEAVRCMSRISNEEPKVAYRSIVAKIKATLHPK